MCPEAILMQGRADYCGLHKKLEQAGPRLENLKAEQGKRGSLLKDEREQL